MNSEIIKPDYVEVYKDHDIVVRLKGSEKVALKEGQYSIKEKLGIRYIEGNGIRYAVQQNGSLLSQPFEGAISLDEIQSIEVQEFSNIKTSILIAIILVPVSIILYGLR
jgi:hypothetical protein